MVGVILLPLVERTNDMKNVQANDNF